jgi:outer membrane protein OmpA-like peptidoglycan-associated protein
LIATLLAFAASARAEVTMDLHALDALPGGGGSAAPEAPAEHAPAHRPHHKPHTAAKPATPPSAAGPSASAKTPAASSPAATAPAGTNPGKTPTAASPAAPGAASSAGSAASVPPHAPPAATLPTQPPPTAAIVPVVPPPDAAPPAPPPPPPIVAGADTAASATANGLRVTFGKDVTDLSPAIADQIKALLRNVPDSGAGTAETTNFEVVAYATGTPSDPSTARRLSLSRALAVRSVLLADGVPSAHIYVRALGSPTGASQPGASESGASQPGGAESGDAPADRVDLTVLGGNAGAKTQAQ